MVAFVVVLVEQPVEVSVTMTVYRPLLFADTLVMIGFCSEEEKFSGPDQLKLASSELAVTTKNNVSFTQGILLLADAVTVLPMVAMEVVSEEEHPLLSVTVIV